MDPHEKHDAERPPAPLTQAQRRATSRRRLLDAAADLVAEQGVESTSIAEIGERAGYSRGMVRERFGSKAGLMNVLSRDIRDRFVDEVLDPAVGDMTGLLAIAACVNASLYAMVDEESPARAFCAVIGEAMVADPELRPGVAWVLSSYRERFAGYVREAIDAGEVPDFISPEVAGFFIVAVQVGMAAQVFTATEDGQEVDLDSFREQALQILSRSLSTGEH